MGSVKNFIVSVSGLPDGKYKITEFDTYTGTLGKTATLNCTGKKLELTIDELAKDKAFIIKPE